MGFANDDIYAVTDKGNAELKSAGTALSAAELQVLILVDGDATVAQITRRAASLKPADVNEILRKLFSAQLITTANEPSSDGLASGFSTISVPAGFFSSITEQTKAEAEQGVTSLNRSGYYVRISRRPPAERQLKGGGQVTVLIVDDDPDLIKLMRTYLKLEGYNVRIAEKRDDIIAAFRQPPKPDLVLLDVELPDANGFDVLAKMRQHPLLKTVPVIMLTGSATREAVIRGLQAGADGYVTKPFEPDHVVSAVRAVLGLSGLAATKPAETKPGESKPAETKPK
jgi:two-component system OmpR family response regulator